jgi:predicted phage terminase large subunit-like protein
MTDSTHLLDALLRQRFDAFVGRTFNELNPGTEYLPNWHIEAIEHQLMRCVTGEVTRLIITMPPRSLKSICASVAFPAWLLGNQPHAEIISASYAQELSAEFSRNTRQVMNSPWYQRAFPGTRLTRSTEDRLVTSLGGGRIATSVGGPLTGMGGDFIIVDDPMKALDALSAPNRQRVINWIDTTLRSRLNNKQTGVIIVVMQRVHMDDLAGYLLKQDGWTHLNLSAIADVPQNIALPGGLIHHRNVGDVLHKVREPRHVLDRLREEVGGAAFSAQYQQCPVPLEGNLFRSEWIPLLEDMPDRHIGDGVYQSWDMAVKDGETNDYSVCTTWLVQDSKYYLLDIYRARADFPTLRHKVQELALKWRADKVIIEDTANGTPILQELKRDKHEKVKFVAYRPKGDKVQRLSTVTPVMEEGLVFMPANAPWLRALLEELLVFPAGSYDDQVDSISQFLNWHRNGPKLCVRHLKGL